MSDQERGMGASEERRFHSAQDRVNLKVEKRLTRVDILLYVVLALSGLSTLGIHVIDSIYLWHP